MRTSGIVSTNSKTVTVPIKGDGDCIDRLLDSVEDQWSAKAAKDLRECAIRLTQQCVNAYSSVFGIGDVGKNAKGTVGKQFVGAIANGTNGLLYGKVQSGKTITSIASVALGYENGFRCFIFLTSDNVWLGKQTVQRFRSELQGGPIVYFWEDWRKDPLSFAETLKEDIADTGAILISTKNARHLENLRDVLVKAKARTVPCLILDDEADNASLNTNEAKQARDPGANPGPIFDSIGDIRSAVANHVYLQITATPQSLLLQGLDHPCKPSFCELSTPGEDYIGGDKFFENQSPYVCSYDLAELNPLKTGSISVGGALPVPTGLKHALCTFFLGAASLMLKQGGRNDTYSFLAHICHRKINQEFLSKVISSIVRNVDQALRNKLSVSKKSEELKALDKAYQELSKTEPNLPPLQALIKELTFSLRNAIPDVINSDKLDSEPQYRPGLNILIGGNRLGRGVTIKGLMTTYYGRDAKTKMMDTVHQHARMFGYRKKLLAVTRLFLPPTILRAFKAIHDADEGTREAIGSDGSVRIKPVWVGTGLKPTRANILNPSLIGAFAPGRAIFPAFPKYKKRDIGENTAALEKMLEKYKKDEEYYEVSIDFMIKLIEQTKSEYDGGTWEDSRVREALRQVQLGAIGISKGRLNVRRGKNAAGLELTNQVDGFDSVYDSTWVNVAKTKYPDVPTLLMLMQKGSSEDKWDDCRVYIPTLVMPNAAFAIVFSYPEST